MSWSDVMRRPGGGEGMGPTDGQQAFMTLPSSDMTIPVQVDYSQASKKADEKRERNARASTRHRRKKKTMQENLRQLQDLKDERQQIMEEMEDLKRQRDFYRDDRNRLREMVAQTSGVYAHAGGPASPSAKSTESHTERSPGHPGQMPTSSHGYASDPSSAERPAQRRRTDEFATSVFGTLAGAPPAALAPLPGGSAYGGPVRPPSGRVGGWRKTAPSEGD